MCYKCNTDALGRVVARLQSAPAPEHFAGTPEAKVTGENGVTLCAAVLAAMEVTAKKVAGMDVEAGVVAAKAVQHDVLAAMDHRSTLDVQSALNTAITLADSCRSAATIFRGEMLSRAAKGDGEAQMLTGRDHREAAAELEALVQQSVVALRPDPRTN